jgi:hypothetical protein
VKIAAVFFLFCTAPLVTVAQQSAATAPQSPQTQTKPSEPPAPAPPATKPAPAIDPAKDAAIRKLFDVEGTKDTTRQVLAGMSDKMKPMLESSLPAGEYRAQLIDLFFQKFQSKLSVDQLVELAIPVYDRYFSLEDIEGLTKFYGTPLGKKVISVLPQVLLEVQGAGMKLGERVGRDSMMEVLGEHPDLKKSLEEAAAAPRS